MRVKGIKRSTIRRIKIFDIPNNNRLGQMFFVTLMLAVVAIILVLALVPSIQEITNNARNTTYMGQEALDCSNSSISDEMKAACITTDLSLPYFIGIVLGIAGAAIGARLIIGG